MSEFLRIKQRNGEIPQKENRKNECNQRNEIHVLPQFLKCLDVEKRHSEEESRQNQHRHILHHVTRNLSDRIFGAAPAGERGTHLRRDLLAQDRVWLVKRLSAGKNF